MQNLNLIVCAILFFSASWAILSPHFDDGIIMKKALIIIALSSMSSVLHSGDPGYIVSVNTVVLNIAFALMTVSMVLRRFIRPVWSSHDRKSQHR